MVKLLRSEKLTPYLLIMPSAILIVVILIYPLVTGIINSFLNINLLIVRPTKFIGLQNYINLLHDPLFWISFKQSVLWTIIILIGEMIIGFFIALLLNTDIKGRKIFRTLILIPWLIPNSIAAIIWKWLYSEQYGLINYLLWKFHIIKTYKAWLGDPHLTFGAVVVAALWKAIPFVVLVILAGLQSISKDLYEAAEVDGASGFHKLIYITIPSVKNIALITAILTSIWNFNQFDIIQVMTRGGPGTATLTMPVFSYELFLQSFQVSYASAVATIMLILMVGPIYVYVKRLMANE
ncbi:binding-protein-dependent transport systems inner membrane component [Caldicellulosiruptor saccharolyticus DSM 8903]|uniref:Binding-protein-dependent transport systems inner membrane component n=1 Tax=Caldicellulosiruptor saccharolyticus (strain ATCC 43494 / DSM 8903 / Tp8T 6331) TaxID=351627 RepID=A4XN21_CALS8|nr:sugar ABC transporter permease [Caldicellulosiruptor saccharolyticus]ABP68306.1 binding-protein-dependent transport systems inner membrane component [Caldicellulosiruptor saccharolyticus DSM 8903]